MDVVLLKPIEKLGEPGAVITVRSGYARNFLIPSGLAAEATSQQLKALESTKAQKDQQAAKTKALATALKNKIEGHAVTLQLALGEGDKAFGSVTAHDIAEALKKEQLTIEKHAIKLDEPIKALGKYDVPIRLHPDVTAVLTLWVAKA